MSYSRSSGPGGQNVNKVNTKVDLRFHVETAEWLTQELKEKIAEKVRFSSIIYMHYSCLIFTYFSLTVIYLCDNQFLFIIKRTTAHAFHLKEVT